MDIDNQKKISFKLNKY